MSSAYRFLFEVPGYGRSASDTAWETIESEHIDTWKSALEILNVRKLKVAETTVVIEADWKPILKKHTQHYAVMQRLKGVKKEKELVSILGRFPRKISNVKLRAEVIGSRIGLPAYAFENLANNAVQSYLHDCFLILNICSPSCCEFHRAALVKSESRTDISLSNVHFDIGLLSSLNEGWPAARTLPLNQVVEWFDSVRVGATQIPQNPMEKVLFALLHIAELDVSPMIVIWLFYAFESLLQTRVGENFSSMIQRMILLLELDEKGSKILRSKFRALYNIRSAIVHGGFEVTHPMHSEILDKRVEDNYARISSAAEYGFIALLAAIQNTIVRGWKYPIFTEKMGGVSIVS